MMNLIPYYLLMAMLVALSMPALAQKSTVLEFQGVPLGAPEAEFTHGAPMFIDCKAVPKEMYSVGDRVCLFSRVAAEMAEKYADCDPKILRKGASRERCLEANGKRNYGGAMIVTGGGSFYGNKLGRVTVDVKPSDFDTVTAALEEKYGPPQERTEPPYVTKGGLRDKNTKLTWLLPDGRIDAVRYANNINTANITLVLTLFLEEFTRRSNAITKENAKKL